MHRPGFGASRSFSRRLAPRGRRRALTRLHSTFVRLLAPLAWCPTPRARGFRRACMRCRADKTRVLAEPAVVFSNEQHRRRYVEDRKHREEKLAANRAYRAAHRDRLNAERRDKWRSDAVCARATAARD